MEDVLQRKIEQYRTIDCNTKKMKFWVADSNLWNWTFCALTLDGFDIKKGVIAKVLKGEMVEDIPIASFAMINGYKNLYSDMISCLEMQMTPNVATLLRWAEDVFPLEEASLRRDNPVIFQWSYVPPHFGDLKRKIDKLFNIYSSNLYIQDPAELASWVCLEFLKLYPFSQHTIQMSVSVLMYALMQAGHPLPLLSCSEQEFNKMVSEYINKKDPSKFVDMLRRSLINRYEAVIDVALQAPEDEEETGNEIII